MKRGDYPIRFWSGLLILSLLGVMFLPSEALARQKRRGKTGISARGAVFLNADNGQKYYSRNANKAVLPASTTKVMTALLVLERLPLDRVVTTSSRATQAQPTKIYARPGERFKVRDLMYALLLSSANDASIILAEAVSGSEQEFVQLMNRRARELGARNTRFSNSNGLPTKGGQYTTASDMALIFRAALKHPFFRKAVQVKSRTIRSLGGRKIALKSHNKMLFKGWKNNIYGKTGYTRAAGQCFVGYVMKGDKVCVISIFGCSRRWSDIKHIISKYGGIAL